MVDAVANEPKEPAVEEMRRLLFGVYITNLKQWSGLGKSLLGEIDPSAGGRGTGKRPQAVFQNASRLVNYGVQPFMRSVLLELFQ